MKPPIKKAVAIQYQRDFVAPKVIAKGSNYMAERIITQSQIHKEIPIIEDQALVKELFDVELGMNIPPELYEVVAQVFIFINHLDQMQRRNAYEK